MNGEKAAQYIADGGSVQAVEELTDLDVKMVSPDKVAVDEMNERTHDTLDTADLEDSVEKMGVVEPPVCRVIDEDAAVPYGVIQGQRRVTAAQTVGLDEIPILIGDFDDREALKRSITENIDAASQDVSPQSRAYAIWRLHALEMEMLGNSVDADDVPSASDVAFWLNVPNATATRWIEPLRGEWKNTILDGRISYLHDESPGGETTLKPDDVSNKILAIVRRMGLAENEDPVEIVEEISKNALSREEVRQVQTLVSDHDADPVEAIEAQAEARKEAKKAQNRFMLKRFWISGNLATGLKQAEEDLGVTREDIVKEAVGDYLEREGYK